MYIHPYAKATNAQHDYEVRGKGRMRFILLFLLYTLM
jgi:hypothetical protein